MARKLTLAVLATAVLAGACSAPAPKVKPPAALDPAIGQQQPIELGFSPAGGQVATSGGGSSSSSTPVGSERPLRVMLWGDSVLFTIEPSLLTALQSTGAALAYPQAFPGWGLSTDQQWRDHLGAMLAADRPDLVLAMWLWDASWAKRDPKGYDAALEAFVERCLEGANAAKGLILLDWPKAGNSDLPMAADGTYPERDPAGHLAWLAAARRVAARHPGEVLVVDLTSTMLLRGRAAVWLPPATDPKAPPSQWVRARHDDAVHVCAEAAARFSARLLVLLHRMVGLPLPPARWKDGQAVPTSDDVLWQAVMAQQQADQQASSADCPADHPPIADNGQTP